MNSIVFSLVWWLVFFPPVFSHESLDFSQQPGRTLVTWRVCSAGSAAQMARELHQPGQPGCAKYAASQRPVSAVCSSGRCILRPPLLQSGPSLSTAAPSQHQCLGPRVAASTTGLITVRL